MNYYLSGIVLGLFILYITYLSDAKKRTIEQLGIRAKEEGIEALENKVIRRVIAIFIFGATISLLFNIAGVGGFLTNMQGTFISIATVIGITIIESLIR